MNIRELCYELYKVDWLETHTNGYDISNCLKNYYRKLESESYTFDDYLDEYGYNGELYVSFDEFCENEYLDEDCIFDLLKDPDLCEKYEEDVFFIGYGDDIVEENYDNEYSDDELASIYGGDTRETQKQILD